MKFNFFKILFLIVLSFGACKPPAKVLPVVPPLESASFDFSFFEQTHKENTNFSFVSEKVLEWKSFLEDTIKIHSAILSNAKQNDFEFQKEKTWMNSFSFNTDGNYNYSTKFFGIIDVDTVYYKSFLSYDTISDLLYIDGSAYQDNKIGQWFFNKPIIEENEYKALKIFSIDWDFSHNNHIKFINNEAGSYNLNYLFYIDSVDNNYNAYLDIYNKGQENHSFIQWNKIDNKGRVKDKLRFNNDEWHYWDANFQDVN